MRGGGEGAGEALRCPSEILVVLLVLGEWCNMGREMVVMVVGGSVGVVASCVQVMDALLAVVSERRRVRGGLSRGVRVRGSRGMVTARRSLWC